MQENLYTAEGRPSNSHFAVIKFPFLDLACFVVARKMHNGFNSILKKQFMFVSRVCSGGMPVVFLKIKALRNFRLMKVRSEKRAPL